MKSSLFILSFIYQSLFSYSQTESAAKMIEEAVRSLKELGTIICIDSSMNFYGRVSDGIKKGNLDGYFDATKVTLHFKKSEVAYLDSEFKKDSIFAWKAKILDNFLVTTYDSANYYRDIFLKKQNDKEEKRYFHFSRVIYFRNNSMAVFRLAEMFRYSAGNDYLFFYQKVDDQWKRYMKVSMGAW